MPPWAGSWALGLCARLHVGSSLNAEWATWGRWQEVTAHPPTPPWCGKGTNGLSTSNERLESNNHIKLVGSNSWIFIWYSISLPKAISIKLSYVTGFINTKQSHSVLSLFVFPAVVHCDTLFGLENAFNKNNSKGLRV